MTKAVNELRLKAEACRRLAELSEDTKRAILWTERAAQWDRLAAKAAKRPRQAKHKKGYEAQRKTMLHQRQEL
jgi:hypothetical protein